MFEKCFSQLQLYGGDCPVTGQILNWSGSTVLRERLLLEISALERQREQREQVDGKMDFSLQQTCKEMIHARQMLYLQLRR